MVCRERNGLFAASADPYFCGSGHGSRVASVDGVVMVVEVSGDWAWVVLHWHPSLLVVHILENEEKQLVS
jgi:hypothetical protein